MGRLKNQRQRSYITSYGFDSLPDLFYAQVLLIETVEKTAETKESPTTSGFSETYTQTENLPKISTEHDQNCSIQGS